MALKIKKKAPAPNTPTEEFDPVWGNSYGINQEELPEIIPSIEGKVTKLYQQKPMTTSKGESTMQGGELMTEHGPIKFILFGNDEIPQNLKGKKLRFSSGKGKGGLDGVQYNLNSYDDKKTGNTIVSEQLVMSYRAEIEEVDGGSVSTAKATPTSKAAPPKTATAQETTVEYDSAGKSGRDNFDEGVADLVNKQLIVDRHVRETYGELGYPEETLVSYVMNAMITAEHMGILNWDITVPAKQPKKAAVAAPQAGGGETTIEYDPEKWAETIVPLGNFKGQPLVKMPKLKIIEFAAWAAENNKSGGFWDVLANAANVLAFDPKQHPDSAEPEDDDIPF